MKQTLFIDLLSFFWAIASPSYSQTTKLSLDLKNTSVKVVLEEIESQSEFFFLYSEKIIDVNRKVNVDVNGISIEKILDYIFARTNTLYTIKGRQIVLTSNDANYMSKAFLGDQQQKSVSGKVTDAIGQSVNGVSVIIKGTAQGTITDYDGKYSLSYPTKDVILKFSFVGMKSQEIPLNGKSIIDVTMVEATIGIDEVVAIGYGTMKKEILTSAVATVDKKTFDSRPIQNVSEGLQGIVPGLNITRGGEGLSGKPQINIRGITTIGQGSSGSPLILIDGMEGDIGALNPDVIESISVLKDAAASAIYGSRAPFGVILVTTKAGQSGKMKITYNVNLRSKSPIVMPEQLNSTQFANLVNLGFTNEGNTPFFTPEHLQRIIDYEAGKLGKSTITQKPGSNLWDDGYAYGNDNVNWFKKIYKASTPGQEHSLSFTGGDNKVTFYLAGDYLNQEGLMALNQDDYKRYIIVGKLTAKLTEWATITYNTRFTREDNTQPTALNNNLYGTLARQAWPTLPFNDPNGFLYSSPSPALSLRDGGHDISQTDWNIQQVTFTLKPIKNWEIVGSINSKIGNFNHHWDILPTNNHDVNGVPYYAGQNWYFGTNNTVAHEDDSKTNYFTPNIYTDYSKSFGKHNLKLMVGYQSELNNYRTITAERTGLLIPSLPSVDLTNGEDPSSANVSPTVGGNYSSWATEGYFSRLNYNYDDRYLVEIDARYDGSSRFQGNQAWNFFPSGSLGWIVSRESFWKPLEEIVSFFKVRGSFGQLGNQNTTNWYPTYQAMPVGTANGNWLINDHKPNTASAPGLISTALTWEKIKTYDGGVDFALLNNHLTSSFDTYVRYTNDMIGPAPELPVILGTSVPITNNEDLRTNGWELSLGWKDRLANGFGFNVDLSISDSHSTITRYTNITGTLSPDVNGNVFYQGARYGDIWGFQTIGIANTQAEMDAHLLKADQTAEGNHWSAGDIIYADLNGDGKVTQGANTMTDHGDLKVIGNFTPRYLYGIILGADWKSFDFRAFIQGVAKRDYMQNSRLFWGESGPNIWDQVLLKQALNYWSPTHTDAYYPRPLSGDGKNIYTQTRYLQNAAYIRLKNLQFGYTISENISRKFVIQKCRFYISGENILTMTKLAKMFDPETIDAGTNGLTGNGGDVYPLMKTYSCGLSITF